MNDKCSKYIYRVCYVHDDGMGFKDVELEEEGKGPELGRALRNQLECKPQRIVILDSKLLRLEEMASIG